MRDDYNSDVLKNQMRNKVKNEQVKANITAVFSPNKLQSLQPSKTKSEAKQGVKSIMKISSPRTDNLTPDLTPAHSPQKVLIKPNESFP